MTFTLSALVTGTGMEDTIKTGKEVFFSFTDILYIFYNFILSLFPVASCRKLEP